MAAFRGLMGKVPTGALGALFGIGSIAYGVSESVFTGSFFWSCFNGQWMVVIVLSCSAGFRE
jgi:hypothetical protein